MLAEDASARFLHSCQSIRIQRVLFHKSVLHALGPYTFQRGSLRFEYTHCVDALPTLLCLQAQPHLTVYPRERNQPIIVGKVANGLLIEQNSALRRPKQTLMLQAMRGSNDEFVCSTLQGEKLRVEGDELASPMEEEGALEGLPALKEWVAGFQFAVVAHLLALLMIGPSALPTQPNLPHPIPQTKTLQALPSLAAHRAQEGEEEASREGRLSHGEDPVARTPALKALQRFIPPRLEVLVVGLVGGKLLGKGEADAFLYFGEAEAAIEEHFISLQIEDVIELTDYAVEEVFNFERDMGPLSIHKTSRHVFPSPLRQVEYGQAKLKLQTPTPLAVKMPTLQQLHHSPQRGSIQRVDVVPREQGIQQTHLCRSHLVHQ